MSAATQPGQPTYVRLQAENMDLRAALEKAKEQVAELKQALSQGTVHLWEDPSKKTEADGLLSGLAAATKKKDGAVVPEGYMTKEAFDAMQAEYKEYVARLNEYIAQKDADLARADEDLLKMGEEVETTKMELAALKATAEGSDSSKKELQEAKKLIADQRKIVDELNAALEQRDAIALEQAMGGEGSGGGISEEEMQKKLDELRQHLEDETVQISCEMQNSLNDAAAEIARLQGQLHGLIQERDSAVAEKSIALRVMNEAVTKCGKLQSSLETAEARIKTLLAQLQEGSASPKNTPVASPPSPPPVAAPQKPTNEAIDFMNALHDKDAVISHLKKRLAVLEVDNNAEEVKRRADEEAKQQTALRELEGALEDMRVKLRDAQTKLAKAEADSSVAHEERDRAMAAGRRAFSERNSALDAQKKAEEKQKQLERLQQKLKGQESAATVQNVFATSADVYDGIVKAVDDAKSEDDRRQVLMDFIFDYERKMWHLHNDLKSANTVRQIREQDLEVAASAAWSKRCEEYMSAVEILRMQVLELGKQPAC